MNTKNTRSLEGHNRHRNPQRSLSQLRHDYRIDWVNVIENNPSLSRKQLMNTANFLYLWLGRNDAKWFEQHLPPVKKTSSNIARLNWGKIDKDLSKKVETACRKIYNSKSFPVRVSITEVIRRIGYKKWIEKRKDKLPLTKKALNKNLESLEDYMIRKLLWAKEQFIKEGKIPTELQLKVRAVIRNKTSDQSDKVQQAVKIALQELKIYFQTRWK